MKVEATKFTEVGYVGRDVESIIRDLVEASVRICKEQASQKVKARATVLAEDRIVDLILHPNRKPANPIDVLLGNKPKQPELPEGERQRLASRAEELRGQLMRGELENVEIEVEVEDAPKDVEINGASVNIGSMMGDMLPRKTKMRRMKVADARRILIAEEEGNSRGANLVLLGAYVAACGGISMDAVCQNIDHSFTGSKAKYAESNKRLARRGYDLVASQGN